MWKELEEKGKVDVHFASQKGPDNPPPPRKKKQKKSTADSFSLNGPRIDNSKVQQELPNLYLNGEGEEGPR